MKSDGSSSPLSGSVASGAAWLAAARILVRAIGLVSTIILARLLVPADFGLVALATALVFVLETFSDLRFEQAIIAQRDTRDTDLNTAWTLNLLRGVLVAAVVAALAHPYALLMDDPRLAGLLLVLALGPLLDGLKNPAFVTFEKSLVFQREFALQLLHKLAAFVITVTLAWVYRSYWALVAGILAGTAMRVLASYLMHPFRPRPALSSWRRLTGFSGWLMASNLITGVLQKAEFFLIGAFLPVRVVGLFHIGSEISYMASHELVLPVKRALFPALSGLGDDRQRQYQSFCLAIEVISAIALPIGLGLALVAEPFVLLALGERWRDAVDIVHVLGPVAALWAIAGICDTLTMARGNTRLIFLREIVRAGFVIPAYTLGLWLAGLAGFLQAAIVVVLLSLWLNLYLVRHQSGAPLLQPLRGTWRSVLAVLVMAGVVLAARLGMPPAAAPSALLGQLLVLVASGAGTYIATHIGLWRLAGRPPGAEQQLLEFIAARRARSAARTR